MLYFSEPESPALPLSCLVTFEHAQTSISSHVENSTRFDRNELIEPNVTRGENGFRYTNDSIRPRQKRIPQIGITTTYNVRDGRYP